MSKQRLKLSGFALISVLVFLEIFAVITVFCLHSASWELTLATARFEKNKMSQSARTILQNVEFLAETSACYIPVTPAYQLSSQPIAWWEKHSCAGNFNLFQYYYVVEPLQDDSCALLDTGRAAHYSRITLLTMLKADHRIKMILQSSVITAGNVLPHCESALHAVKLGRQSAREITY
jgi:hypothetical protein